MRGWRAVGGVDRKYAANQLGAVCQGPVRVGVGSLNEREKGRGGGRVGRVEEAGVLAVARRRKVRGVHEVAKVGG